MLIKVCGIKTEENIKFLSDSDIEMVGLNFYKPSVRYITEKIDPSIFDKFKPEVKRVGVFVNEQAEQILDIAKKYKLDYVQLHGDEDQEFCEYISNSLPIIKVFRIDEKFDFKSIGNYAMASLFLFDTQTIHYGGSGKKFDWKILMQYTGTTPFLLSGGIGPDDHIELSQIDHPQFIGIDINSKFESAPGVKDRNLIIPFINSIRES